MSTNPREEINALIIEADAELNSGNVGEAMKKYGIAREKAEAIDWQERVTQIIQIIAEYEQKVEHKKKKEEEAKKAEEERKKKQEEDKKLEAARMRIISKQEVDKQQKLEALRKKKELEDKTSNEAYRSLEIGSTAIQKGDYIAGIQAFQNAITQFNSIKWTSEVSRIQELLEDTQAKYDSVKTKQEAGRKETEHIRQKALETEQKTQQDNAKRDQQTSQTVIKQKEADDKSRMINDLGKKAMNLIDQANLDAKGNQYAVAIEKLYEAKKIFQDIGWTNEADKVLVQASLFREKQAKYELEQKKVQEFILKKQQEEQELQKQIEIKKRIQESKHKEEEDRLQKEQEDRKYAQTIADEVFRQVDLIEQEVKKYQDDVRKGKILYIECIYPKAIELYKNGHKQLRDVGWLEQAEKFNEAVRTYQELLVKDERFREIEGRKIETRKQEELDLQKQIETSHRVQAQKEEERQQVIQKELSKSERERQINLQCMTFLDKAQIHVKKAEYDAALKIYMDVLAKYQSIEYSDGVRLTKETILKVEQEQASLKEKAELVIKAHADHETQQKQLEIQIKQAKEESERKRLELRQKILQEETHRNRETVIQEEIIKLLEEGGKLLIRNLFDAAIEKYRTALDLLKDISWPLKQEQIHDTIKEATLRKLQYLEKQKQAQENKVKQEAEQKALEEKYNVMETQKKAKELEMQKAAAMVRNKADIDKQLSDDAWKLIDLGENSVKNQREYLALYQFHQSFLNFEKVGWTREAGAAKKRFVEVYGKIKNPVIDLTEMLENANKEAEEKIIKSLNDCISAQQRKDFDGANKFLLEVQQALADMKWIKSFNLIQQYQGFLKEEEKHHIEYEANKGNIPSQENAMRLLDEARIKVERLKYDEAIILGTKAKAMFDSLNWERESNMVNQELMRWKFKAEKIADQIREVQATADAKEKQEDSSMQNLSLLSEDERRKMILEDRKKTRRDAKK